jgi:hypothetical protein
MASDQRYCVECGERRGSARVPLIDGSAQSAQKAHTPRPRPQPRPARMSVNSTLIAGIGTLLLAMGVGVLIGRSGDNASVKNPPAQIVTVPGAGAATSTTATPAESGASASPTTKSGAAHATPPPKPHTKSTPTKSAAPPPKAVKIGTPGHGQGYQNGHFTGNFFGE